jgi:2-amino-4-hydroxy-6-hydroxymethyldihydropteridine diphosphokinase / dihydropteroate synthase
LEPLPLLDQLQDIEKSMGRQKLIEKGPRNIDLDILLYKDTKVDHERLQIPHIGIPEREFVLRPLAELIPQRSIDSTKPWKLIQDYLNELPPASEPLSTLSPTRSTVPPLKALKHNRTTNVMAILNITPDSFSDGGTHTPDSLRDTVLSFARSGATMIDIGGQSTAPGTPEVSPEVEMERVVPVIEFIRSLPETRNITISVDTYRASVAEAAVDAGADIINDVSAGLMDPEMLPTMARLGKTVCLMHMRGTPATMSKLTAYPVGDGGLIATIASELLARVRRAALAHHPGSWPRIREGRRPEPRRAAAPGRAEGLAGPGGLAVAGGVKPQEFHRQGDWGSQAHGPHIRHRSDGCSGRARRC